MIDKIIGVAILTVAVNGLGLTTDCSDGDDVDLKEVRSRARVLIPQSD